MTDHRTRLAARDPDFAESVEDLLRRQRAGLIRQVDVGPCTSCDGSKRCKPGDERLVKWEPRTATTGYLCCCGDVDCAGLWNGSHDLVHACDYYETECDCDLEEAEVRRPVYDRSCAPCNGTGRRYRCGLELAAYCGHAAARLVVGSTDAAAVRRWAWADERRARVWWDGVKEEFGQEVCAREPAFWTGELDTARSKARLIRWALGPGAA